ncbi:P-loop ATPase, Sll1717 family [Streptomyces triculaminicus]|uniref:P-loop ATPase, Sll1717 family n=1 Tax=Streptomyces triculaminicus TaxID=2816232 RepID=UPI00378A67D5
MRGSLKLKLSGSKMDIMHLYFGKASAESEIAADSERFLNTYLDRWDLLRQVGSHEKFLILGPKGSGKSAAAYYVELSWKKELGENRVFADFVDFDDLNKSSTPLSAIDKKIVSEQISSPTETAWKLFIGVKLLESLVRDHACSLSADPQVLKLLRDMSDAGLASDDYPKVLRRVRERRAGINLRVLSGERKSKEEAELLSPAQLAEAIMGMICQAGTPNRHLLSINGLDKAIGDNDAYWRTCAALIRVGAKICHELQVAGNRSIYLLIMCRSDVFRRIIFADSQKIAADRGVHMEWGAEARNALDVTLWEYIARKAGIETSELFSLFPKFVYVGKGGKRPIELPKYLLDFTRYTPRDMSQLFDSVRSRAVAYQPLTGEQVRSGADYFATFSLLHEIMSEAKGLLPDVVVNRLEQIISTLPAVRFDSEDLKASLEQAEVLDSVSLMDFAEYLFLQGAVGNYRRGTGYVQFYHRRNTATFDRHGPWVLHTGLAYALNIPFSSIRK